jgi:hypothetical protein
LEDFPERLARGLGFGSGWNEDMLLALRIVADEIIYIDNRHESIKYGQATANAEE